MKKTKILGMSLPMLAIVAVGGYFLYNKFVKKGVTYPPLRTGVRPIAGEGQQQGAQAGLAGTW